MSIELGIPSSAEHKEAIRERIRARCATAADFVAYNLLRGKPAYQGFQPAGAGKHLKNGKGPFDGFLRATQQYRNGAWAAFRVPSSLQTMFTPAHLAELRAARVKLLCDTFQRAKAETLPQDLLRGLLRWTMAATPQGRGNVLEHCKATATCAVNLVNVKLSGGKPTWQRYTSPAWMPDWFAQTKHLVLSPKEYQTLYAYLKVHDCGKPFVYEEDADGRVHFADHARVSAEVWQAVGGSEDEQYLIAHDMDLHTLKADGLEAFAEHRLAKVQLLAALASLWANQDDFGGVDSVSFKCKLKHLDRRGRALCKLWDAKAPQAIAA